MKGDASYLFAEMRQAAHFVKRMLMCVNAAGEAA